ncbi:hypothetical protein K8640_24330 [Myxococcus sp. XM-1-1-1]|uniref:hypothetical protein n=1 Tax=Myxococcus sp. XM-1-1-1 TaxID=2874602 RepID=UPI001CC0F225|nr:hypothetical protein [Myxococcus sp. XM-1-1-1]MBZ4411346.1 hypothetical protein [Myxococcus sp. XM-1-1-1]
MMNVYTTEFPAKPGAGFAEILKICHVWLSQSPHYKLKKLQALSTVENEISDFSVGMNNIFTAEINQGGEKRVGIQHSTVERGRRKWTAEIVASEGSDCLWVSVAIGCEVLVPGEPPPVPKKPFIIGQLFSKVGGGNDGPLVAQDKPFRLGQGDLELAKSIVLRTSSNHLPVVYVSCGFNGRSPVDTNELASRLSGLAHVVVEPNRIFSMRLAPLVSSSNPYGGALGLFWPGSRGRVVRYLPSSFESIKELLDTLDGDLRQGWLFWRSPRNNSWAQIKEAISSAKIQELKLKGSQSLNEFMEAFDQENAALRRQIQEGETRQYFLEETLRKLQSQNQQGGELRFVRGKEAELFPGETRDGILRTLQEDRVGLSQDSRRKVILDDFLEANQASGTASELETSIKNILSKTDRISAAEIKSLEGLGFSVADGGKHYKAVFGGEPRLTFSLFKTASDYRAGRNLASDIVKRILGR